MSEELIGVLEKSKKSIEMIDSVIPPNWTPNPALDDERYKGLLALHYREGLVLGTKDAITHGTTTS